MDIYPSAVINVRASHAPRVPTEAGDWSLAGFPGHGVNDCMPLSK